MSVPPRTHAPSAMDGYRRIVRATVDDAADPGVDTTVRSVRRSRRIAGATRVVGLLAVIAVIAGTSYGLATADPNGTSSERTAQQSTEPDVSGELIGPPAPVARAERAAKVTPAPAAAPVQSAKAATAAKPVAVQAAKATPAAAMEATATGAPATRAVGSVATTRELPFTGAADVMLLRLLLAGAGLALLGMLVQIAGTPLPAHAMERKRLDSRAT